MFVLSGPKSPESSPWFTLAQRTGVWQGKNKSVKHQKITALQFWFDCTVTLLNSRHNCTKMTPSKGPIQRRISCSLVNTGTKQLRIPLYWPAAVCLGCGLRGSRLSLSHSQTLVLEEAYLNVRPPLRCSSFPPSEPRPNIDINRLSVKYYCLILAVRDELGQRSSTTLTILVNKTHARQTVVRRVLFPVCIFKVKEFTW